DRQACADRPGRRAARGRHGGAVVVMDVVVDHYPAGDRAGDRADPAVRAPAVLRGGRVADYRGVGVQAVLVAVELGVLDDDLAAGVRARVTERVVLHPHAVHNHVAPPQAGAHVDTRVVHVAAVQMGQPGRA